MYLCVCAFGLRTYKIKNPKSNFLATHMSVDVYWCVCVLRKGVFKYIWANIKKFSSTKTSYTHSESWLIHLVGEIF